MPKVTGINEVRKRLAKMQKQEQEDHAAVIVGYSQRYAIYVHENLEARHAEGKQAKYLEAPARRLSKTLADIIATSYRKTRSMEKSLLLAGLRLQRESQEIVPIDTSALKASAYTALEKDADKAAEEAFQRSESVRMAAQAARDK